MAIEPLTAKWTRAIIGSVVGAAAIYLVVVLWVGRVQVSAALQRVSLGTVTALLALSLLNYGLRFLRWHQYLRALGSGIPFLHDLRIYLGGFALTTTPGKAGEMARTLWLRPYGVPAPASLAAFLAERIQDFLVIILMSGAAASLYRGGRWPLLVGAALIVVVALSIFAPRFVEAPLGMLVGRHPGMRRLSIRLLEILVLTRRCLTPGRFVIGLLLGMAAWCAEGIGFYLLLHSFGQSVSPASAVSIYALSMLAGAVSFMPGGLGGSEATMILLLRILDVPLPVAVSSTLIVRLTTLWFAVALGAVALSIGVKAPGPDAAEVAPVSPAPLRRSA